MVGGVATAFYVVVDNLDNRFSDFFRKSDNILYYTIIKLLSRTDILDTILKA